MKKYLSLLIIPLTSFASYDLAPIDECERLKENMINDLNQQESNILEGLNPGLQTITTRIGYLVDEIDEIRRLDSDNDYESLLLNIREHEKHYYSKK